MKLDVDNYDWTIYEIPGHKIGVCATYNFPKRPNSQVNKLLKRPKASRVKEGDVIILQQLEDLTMNEALEVETEWQDKLGYVSDIDANWIRSQSDKRRQQLSAAGLGSKHTQEVRDRMSASHKGKTFSAETRAKLSAAAKGKIISDETKAKMSASRKGFKHSEESKAKISEAFKGKPMSEETKAKISESHKKRYNQL